MHFKVFKKLDELFFTPLERHRKIDLVGSIILLGFFCAFVYNYICGVYFSNSFPYNSFLFIPSDRFMDFIHPYNMVVNPSFYALNHISFFCHFPFAYVLHSIFTILPPYPALALYLMIFFGGHLAITAMQLSSKDMIATHKNTIIFSLFTYPFLFALDRANDENLIYLLLFAHVILFSKKRYWESAIPLSIAIAIKPFPIVFLALYATDKRFRLIPAVLIAAMLMNVFSASMLEGGFYYVLNRYTHALEKYHFDMAIKHGGLPFGHSLWGPIKMAFYYRMFEEGLYLHDILEKLQVIIKGYTIIAAISLLAVFSFMAKNRMSLWRRVALIVISMNLFPYVSGDYKLMHLFIPLYLFINTKERSRRDLIYCMLFGLLMIPKGFYFFPYLDNVNLGVVLNPFFMTLFIGFIVDEVSTKKKTGD